MAPPIVLPDPLKSPFRIAPTGAPGLRGMAPPMLADHIAALTGRVARRTRLHAVIGGAAAATPARWFRPEPRPSIQYAGHMSTEAARDRRLTGQSKALLQILRARCGTGTHTATCKTTLAHIMGVSVRSIGRYLHELKRFGYLDLAVRHGRSGLHIGILAAITQKVLPCFRRPAWLAGWLAANLAGLDHPQSGESPGRTVLSCKNHPLKDLPVFSSS